MHLEEEEEEEEKKKEEEAKNEKLWFQCECVEYTIIEVSDQI